MGKDVKKKCEEPCIETNYIGSYISVFLKGEE